MLLLQLHLPLLHLLQHLLWSLYALRLVLGRLLLSFGRRLIGVVLRNENRQWNVLIFRFAIFLLARLLLGLGRSGGRPSMRSAQAESMSVRRQRAKPHGGRQTARGDGDPEQYRLPRTIQENQSRQGRVVQSNRYGALCVL